ncbi:MAG: hypothetical protein Q9221_008273 [Calogaya cf. arnoldii]
MSGYPTPSESTGSRSSSSEHEKQVKRRRVQDDRGRSDVPTPPADTPMAQEGYSMQKFRVGVPPLQILPLETIRIDKDNEVAAAVWAKIPIFKFTCIAGKHITLMGTGTDAFEFAYRTIEGQAPTAEHMTLCVKAEWTDGCSRVWVEAANTIRASLRGNPITSAVRVEFISWQLFRPRFTEPLRHDDPIVNAWPQLRREIHRLLNQSQLVSQNWLAIMVIRRGYIEPETEENNGIEPSEDTSVVLLVIMSYDIDPHQWAPQQREIKRLLVQSGLHFVQVEFERGSNDHLAFPLRPPTKPDRHNHAMTAPYDFKIVLGVDCGPARYFEVDKTGQEIPGPNGTVGGIVLVTKSDGTVKKMAVLNYHVARDLLEGSSFTQGVPDPVHADAPPNSELEFVDRNGMRPNTLDTTKMVLESPSRKKHNYTLQKLKNDIQDLHDLLANTDDPEALQADIKILEDEYNDRKKFFDDGKHILGKLWMASGFTRRTSYNGRLDWALVEFQDDSRIGSNKTPRRDQFPIPSRARGDLIEKNLRGVTTCNDVAARAEVFKIGSRTGLTRGSYEELKIDVNFPTHDRPYGMQSSSEHSFVYKGDTNPQPFCNHGDSGSFFWTGRLHLIGQFHGGPKAETLTEGSLMYATDAEELLKDMNDFAGPEYTITMATD